MKKNITFVIILLIILVTGCVKNSTKLDITCNIDDDCKGTCSCGCINKDENCPGDEIKACEWTYNCVCKNGICSKIDAPKNIDDYCKTNDDCINIDCTSEFYPKPEPECVGNKCECTFSYCKNIGGCD